MATAQTGVILRHIRMLVAAQSQLQVTDRELLQRFATQADEAAFTELVRRHGAMVLRVCQRRLHHEQDAEDAFQATFLTLARKAATIRNQDSVGSWLHGVAVHLALQAKTAAARRQLFEKQTLARSSRDPLAEISLREAQTVLDEEMARLPEKYRAPLVLCYLEGTTRDEAVQQLGWSLGTLKRRLEQGREMLRGRLARRGLTLSSALVTGLLAQNAGQGAIAASLVASTARAALLFATGKTAAAGAVSAGAVALLQGVTRVMFWTKLKIVMVLFLAVGLCTAGAGLLTHQAAARQTVARQAEALAAATAQPAGKETDKSLPTASKNQAGDQDLVSGQVVDADGKPVAGAQVYLWTNAVKKRADLKVGATTEADGRFRVAVPAKEKGGTLFAQAKGYGPDWVPLSKLAKGREATLRLVKDDVPIDGRVLDLEGKPIAGVKVQVALLEKPTGGDLTPWIEELKRRMANKPSTQLATEHVREPIWDGPASVTTGADGRFQLGGFGRERIVHLWLRGPTIENVNMRVLTRRGPLDGLAAASNRSIFGSSFNYLAGPSRSIVGTVRDRRTGKPLAGIRVSCMLGGNSQATTDAEGRYRLDGVGKREQYAVSAASPAGKPYFYFSKWNIGDTPGFEPITVDFELQPGILIKGRLTDKATGKPVQGMVSYFATADNPHVKDFTTANQPVLSTPLGRTAPDGSFTTLGIPGSGVLCVRADEADRYPDVEIEGWDGSWLKVVVPGLLHPSQYHAVVPINVAENDPKSTIRDLTLEPGRTRTGLIVGPDDQPLAGVHAAGLVSAPAAWPFAGYRTPSKGLERPNFTAKGLSVRQSRALVFYHPEKKLGKIVPVRGDETDSLTVRLEPLGAVKGRILNASGNPWAGLPVTVEVSRRVTDYKDVPWEVFEGGLALTLAIKTKTDRDGKFHIEGLLPGLKYWLRAYEETSPARQKVALFLENLSAESGKTKDLGDLKSKDTP
jgi:RNA polymerase sigma factor (sigma-70 family)